MKTTIRLSPVRQFSSSKTAAEILGPIVAWAERMGAERTTDGRTVAGGDEHTDFGPECGFYHLGSGHFSSVYDLGYGLVARVSTAADDGTRGYHRVCLEQTHPIFPKVYATVSNARVFVSILECLDALPDNDDGNPSLSEAGIPWVQHSRHLARRAGEHPAGRIIAGPDEGGVRAVHLDNLMRTHACDMWERGGYRVESSQRTVAAHHLYCIAEYLIQECGVSDAERLMRDASMHEVTAWFNHACYTWFEQIEDGTWRLLPADRACGGGLSPYSSDEERQEWARSTLVRLWDWMLELPEGCLTDLAVLSDASQEHQDYAEEVDQILDDMETWGMGSLDLHGGNMMLRDGVLVITDPFSWRLFHR